MKYLCLLLVLVPVVVFAQPIRWTEAEGGNGHWYELVKVSDGVVWDDAKSRAEIHGGYLATFSNQSENEWVYSNVVVPGEVLGFAPGPLIGGFQNFSSPDFVEPGGAWEWVTGEPFVFDGWRGGEPNNASGADNYLEIASFSIIGWNDTPNSDINYHYLVEYEEIDAHSLWFDGIDDYAAGNSVGLPVGNSDRTIEFWIKSDNFAQGGDRKIVGWGQEANNQFCTIALGTMAQPNRQLFFWGWYNDIGWNTPLTDGMWSHAAFTLDAEYARIYLNGELDNEGQMSGLDTGALSDFVLCAANTTGRFSGLLDEVRVWDRALSQDEIRAKMYARLEPETQVGLVGCWHLDEGVGAIAYDSSASQNELNVFGAIWSLDTPELYSTSPLFLEDLPSDHGGYLELGWKGFPADATGLPDSVVSYDAQRLELGTWTTLTSVAATQADSYSVVVSTPDILTMGQPEPFSSYRVVAHSSDPTKFYFSNVDSAYSVDNLPPPKPIVNLFETLESRVFSWAVPSIPDLAEMCVYRGSDAGFTPDVPLVCPATGLFIEEDRNYYFYRFNFSDIHGNLSEFSDEIHPQYPSGVEVPSGKGFSYFRAYPTPFNATVQLSFELNTPSSISLDIYSLDGKRVASVASGFYGEGVQEFTWNGRDEAGRDLASGVFFAKLVAGEMSEVRRLVLVK